MIQILPSGIPKIFGCSPVLVYASAVMIAMLEPETPSICFGLFGGIMMDMYGACPFGFNALLLSITCCFISVYVKRRINVTISSAMIIGIISLAADFILIWFFLFVLMGRSSILFALVDRYLPSYLYTVILLPLFYIFNLGLFAAVPNRK
jgi:rod shape-determining protein MreD